MKEADKYQWSKEELKAYDNVSIKEQDERGEKEFIAQKAMEKGEEKKEIELILEMDKEGFTVPQMARVTKRDEVYIRQVIDNQKNK